MINIYWNDYWCAAADDDDDSDYDEGTEKQYI